HRGFVLDPGGLDGVSPRRHTFASAEEQAPAVADRGCVFAYLSPDRVDAGKGQLFGDLSAVISLDAANAILRNLLIRRIAYDMINSANLRQDCHRIPQDQPAVANDFLANDHTRP